MTNWDWIVIGGGITGTALGYELVKVGFSVLLVEQEIAPLNATRLSYGGIAYWSATTELTRQLAHEGIEIHRTLTAELEAETQFRELDLLLVMPPNANPQAIAQTYSNCALPPTLLSVEAACEMEPLLDPSAISGALHARHGHVEPELIAKAYLQAMLRSGGMVQTARVTGLVQTGDRIHGVLTSEGTYLADNVVICTGGLTRILLRQAGIAVRCYFTRAELVETPPVELRLHTMIMSALQKRSALEATAGSPQSDALWEMPAQEILPPILDPGVVQFQDGRLRIGQISHTLTDPTIPVDANQGKANLYAQVGHLLPPLQTLPGQWQTCLVAFSGDHLPLVGLLPPTEGLYIFSGFSNPFALLPSLARRFARHLQGQADAGLIQLSPNRFHVGAETIYD